MEISTALTFAREHNQGVLTTQKRDGRPQLSNVTYWIDADGVIRISITADRVKYINLSRDPRASLHITRKDFWAYVVLEGDAELTPIAAAPDNTTVDELVDYYREVVGEHEDWDDYRAAMVRDRRLIVRLRTNHAYGML